MLLDVGGNIISEFVQTGSIVAVLAGFLWYFMRELKDVKSNAELQRVSYEKALATMQNKYDGKFDALLQKVFDLEKTNMQTLNDVKESNDRLSNNIAELINKLGKNVAKNI